MHQVRKIEVALEKTGLRAHGFLRGPSRLRLRLSTAPLDSRLINGFVRGPSRLRSKHPVTAVHKGRKIEVAVRALNAVSTSLIPPMYPCISHGSALRAQGGGCCWGSQRGGHKRTSIVPPTALAISHVNVHQVRKIEVALEKTGRRAHGFVRGPSRRRSRLITASFRLSIASFEAQLDFV